MKPIAHTTALLLALTLSATPAHAVWGLLGKLAITGGKAATGTAAGAAAGAEAAAAANAARNAALAAETANAGAHAGTAAAGANATRTGTNAANSGLQVGGSTSQSAALNLNRLTHELSLANSAQALPRFCVRAMRAAACEFRHASSALDALRQIRGPNISIRPGKKPGWHEVLDWSGKVIDVVQVVQQGNAGSTLAGSNNLFVSDNSYVISCRTGYEPIANTAVPQSFADWSCHTISNREVAGPLCHLPGSRAWVVNAGRIGAPIPCPV